VPIFFITVFPEELSVYSAFPWELLGKRTRGREDPSAELPFQLDNENEGEKDGDGALTLTPAGGSVTGERGNTGSLPVKCPVMWSESPLRKDDPLCGAKGILESTLYCREDKGRWEADGAGLNWDALNPWFGSLPLTGGRNLCHSKSPVEEGISTIEVLALVPSGDDCTREWPGTR
jgi:hypothetical protein